MTWWWVGPDHQCLALGVQGCQDWLVCCWVEPDPEVTSRGALRGSRASADPLMGGSRFGCGLGVLQLVDEARFQGHCWPTGGWAGFRGS